MVDARWRARANTIYAGRTFSNEDFAESQQNLRGLMIAISDQFTVILAAYASMYGTFVESLDLTKGMSPEDAKSVWNGLHADFNEAVSEYKARGILALRGKIPMIYPSRTFEQDTIFRPALVAVALPASTPAQGDTPAVRGVRIHDLRHSMATMQLMAGTHFMQVSKWLGHSTFTLMAGPR